MQRFLLKVCASTVVVFASPLSAAERISFQFGEFERSIPISELSSFASGETPDAGLRAALRFLKPAERQSLQKILNQTVPVDGVMASNFLGTALGQRTVQQLVKLLNQPQDVAINALSSALILAASSHDGLRLIDVLQAYPLPSIPVNLAAVGSLARTLAHEFNLQNSLFRRLSGLDGDPATGPDLSSAASSGRIKFEQIPFQFKGRAVDSIKAGLFLPEPLSEPKRVPLVVLAPGLNTDMNALLYVGRTLASHGYAVASLDFPFTSADTVSAAIEGTGAIPPPNAWYRQPITVSDLIDQVRSRWGDRVDTERVGVLGQSLGGYTVTALAGAPLDWANLVKSCRQLNDPATVVLNPAVVWQCAAPGRVVRRADFRDSRVKAAVAVNPVTNPIFSRGSMAQVDVPLLVIAGLKDIFAPPISQQLIPFTAVRSPGSVLAVQDNGTHLSFLDGTSDLPKVVIGPAQPLARTELQGLAKLFFDRHLRADTTQTPLLSMVQSSVLSGQPPLSILLRSTLSMPQLKQVDPGLVEVP